MTLKSSWGWVWEIPFIFFLFLKGEFVFSLFPCIAKSSMNGKPVWLWEPRSNTAEDEKRDAEITALVGGQRVNSWLRTALRSASFLQSEAPWTKLAALLPVNSGFCLQKNVISGRRAGSVMLSRPAESSSSLFRSTWEKQRKTAFQLLGWLCEPYLHGEETSHFLRLDPPLLSIPCTPFGEYKH